MNHPESRMAAFKELCELIQKIQRQEIVASTEMEDGRKYIPCDSEIGLQVSQAMGVLYVPKEEQKSNGDLFWDLIFDLEQQTGVKVGPGEQDSFGWVTACLHTNQGTLVWG